MIGQSEAVILVLGPCGDHCIYRLFYAKRWVETQFHTIGRMLHFVSSSVCIGQFWRKCSAPTTTLHTAHVCTFMLVPHFEECSASTYSSQTHVLSCWSHNLRNVLHLLTLHKTHVHSCWSHILRNVLHLLTLHKTHVLSCWSHNLRNVLHLYRHVLSCDPIFLKKCSAGVYSGLWVVCWSFENFHGTFPIL
jgi:hypothetical protein